MPLRWISPPGPTPASAPASPVPEEPKIVLAAPGSIAARHTLGTVLAAGSLLAVVLRPLPQPQAPRALANTFTVTNTHASGPGSLLQAVQNANVSVGGGTITFQSGLTGTIALTGTLNVKNAVTIVGPGPGVLSVSGQNTRRVFYLYNSSTSPLTATITGLTIRDGATTGGGAGILDRNFDLLLDQVDLIGNSITTTGKVGGSGGGLDFVTGAGRTVSLTIRDSLVSGNHARTGGGLGIFLYQAKGDVIITNTQILSNSAVEGGGGLDFTPGGTLTRSLTIRDSLVSGNHAGGPGGGLQIFLYNRAAEVVITNTQIVSNTAVGDGAGAFLNSPTDLRIEDSTIMSNTAGTKARGGGLAVINVSASGPEVIRRTTISGNAAAKGGGVFVGYTTAPFSIENSTLSGNHATGHGGGVYLYDAARAGIQNSTIVSNTAASGGGVEVHGHFEPITDTIIAGNVAPLGPDISGTFRLRYDLVQITGTAAITNAGGNLFGLDPLLGPLADNGGLTHTHLPARNSPVVNAGDPSFVPPPATDQRGDPRVMGGRIDIGSVELSAELFLPLIRR